nr:hypothetical protein [Candidatus Sigynarchaeota archaeon]
MTTVLVFVIHVVSCWPSKAASPRSRGAKYLGHTIIFNGKARWTPRSRVLLSIMDKQPFLEFYRRFATFKQEHGETWGELAPAFFTGEAKRKWKRYPAFVNHLKKAFASIPAFRTNGIKEGQEPSILSFFMKDFFPLVRDWFVLATGISPANVSLLDARLVYESEILYKCQLHIPADMLKAMETEIIDVSSLAGKMHERELVHIIFETLVDSINFLFKTVIDIDWQLEQLSNLLETRLLETRLDGMYITFLVSFNRYTVKNLPMEYFNGNLLDFLCDVYDIAVDPALRGKMLQMKVRYLESARAAYFDHRDDMLGAIKHFQAKALLLNQVSHMYEILAALISKLDLGVKNVQQLLHEYSVANMFAESDTLLWSYLLDMCTAQALLYETFQSNLRGLKGKSSMVFMIILQYFLIDLKRDALLEKVFHGDRLFDKLERLIRHESGEDEACLEHFTSDFQEFLVSHFKIQDMDDYDVFIKGIFGKSVDRIISRFFSSFLKTSHEHIMFNMEKLGLDAKTTKKITFTNLVSFLGDFLQFCLKTVFFQPSLDLGSKQFKDSSGRFSGDNIATSMVELLLYRELPFHDNQWMATLAAKFRNQVDMVYMIDVKEELMAIPQDILANFVLHDRALKPTTILLHDWFFDEVIKPFHEYSHYLRDHVRGKDLSNEEMREVLALFFERHVPSISASTRQKDNIAKIVAASVDLKI